MNLTQPTVVLDSPRSRPLAPGVSDGPSVTAETAVYEREEG